MNRTAATPTGLRTLRLLPLLLLVALAACGRDRLPPEAPEAEPSAAANPPPGPTVLRDVEYCRAGDVPLLMDVYTPGHSGGQPAPAAVYIHGGAWTQGDKSGGAGFAEVQELVARGYVVASVNYRLAPAYPFPAQIEDVKCAVRHLRANAAAYGLDPNRIGVWGSSAGGHLAALLGLTDSDDGLEGDGGYAGYSSRVSAVVDMFGPADLRLMGLSPRGQAALRGVFPTDADAARASPVTYVSPDDPPFLILHGERDGVVPLRQSEVLHAQLQAAGVPSTLVVVRNAGHGFVPAGGPPAPSRGEIARMVADFFDTHLRR